MKQLKFIFIFILPLLITTIQAQKQVYNITFKVDMSGEYNFYPDEDTVYIAASFTDWSEPGLIDSLRLKANNESLQYNLTIQLADGEYYYKYFINAGWGGAEWAGDPNRYLIVDGANKTTNDYFGGVVDTFYINIPTTGFRRLELFPNPAKDLLTVGFHSDNKHNVSLKIIDLTGKEIKSYYYNMAQNGSYKTEIDVRNLCEGLYLLQINSGKNSETRKINILR